MSILIDIKQGRSETRNRVLANLFKELGLIEKWEIGINKIKKLCINSGLKEPIFSEKNDFIDIEFIRKREIKQKNEGVKKLFILIQEKPSRKIPFFAQELNISVKNIERWIKQLRLKDKIEFRISPKTGGYYAK